MSATSRAARGEHEARPPIAIDRATAEQEVLGTLRALLAELRGGPPPAPVALDDLLDRDLGLGSLERVELVLRLQKRFGVDIPDEALAEAQRGRDIVAAAAGWREIVRLRNAARDEISRGSGDPIGGSASAS